jgi:hypothetical protein
VHPLHASSLLHSSQTHDLPRPRNEGLGWTLRHTSRGPSCFIAQIAIIPQDFGHRLINHSAVINTHLLLRPPPYHSFSRKHICCHLITFPCGCNRFLLGPHGDHVITYKSHPSSAEPHDWMVIQLGPLFQTTGHKVKTQGIIPSSGLECGDIKIIQTSPKRPAMVIWSLMLASPTTESEVAHLNGTGSHTPTHLMHHSTKLLTESLSDTATHTLTITASPSCCLH